MTSRFDETPADNAAGEITRGGTADIFPSAEPETTPRRHLSDRQREWLATQIDDWTGRGILSPDQTARIWELYVRPEEAREQRHSWLLFSIMALAAVLVALGALLLVGYNWDEMVATVKVVLIFGAILAAHGTGAYFRFVREMPRSAEIACFLGCLLYGAGIWQVADIFHITSDGPGGIWLWALGVLPLTLYFNTFLFHTLLVGLLGLWSALEVSSPVTFDDSWFNLLPALPPAAYTLPLLAAPGMLLAYRNRSPATVGLYACLFAWWIAWQPFAWDANIDESWIYVVGSIGALYLVTAECHRPGSRFAIPYRLCGALLAGAVLIPLSFAEVNEELIGESQKPGLFASQMIFLISAMVLAGVGYLEYRRRDESDSWGGWALEIAKRQWLPLGLAFLMAHLAIFSVVFGGFIPSQFGVVAATILVNVAMILFALWLMAAGIREDRGLPFAAGVAYLLLWAVMRYFDLFSDFGGILGAAILFFLCGAALFGLAFYWRRRRELHHV